MNLIDGKFYDSDGKLIGTYYAAIEIGFILLSGQNVDTSHLIGTIILIPHFTFEKPEFKDVMLEEILKHFHLKVIDRIKSDDAIKEYYRCELTPLKK